MKSYYFFLPDNTIIQCPKNKSMLRSSKAVRRARGAEPCHKREKYWIILENSLRGCLCWHPVLDCARELENTGMCGKLLQQDRFSGPAKTLNSLPSSPSLPLTPSLPSEHPLQSDSHSLLILLSPSMPRGSTSRVIHTLLPVSLHEGKQS